MNRLILCLSALLLAAGCSLVHDASSREAAQPSDGLRPAASLSPAELRGRRVVAQDGVRELGKVVEVVSGADGRALLLVVGVNPLLRRSATPVSVDAGRVALRPPSPALVVLGAEAADFAE